MASADVRKLGSAANAFAMDLYQNLCKESGQENMFFSPFSIVSALAMTHVGARESTAAGIKSALRLDEFEDQRLHQTFSELNAALRTDESSAYVLRVANRLFARQNYTFLDDFLNATRKHYQAEAQNVDFAQNPEEARVTINTWVEEQTAQKIKELFKAGGLSQDTAMILVNAIYFKGDWEEKFDPQHTRKADFMVSPEETIQVDMMFKEDDFHLGYSEELDAQSIEIPYKSGDLSMVCILPNQPGTLAQLESKLTLANLQALLASQHKMKAMLHLPKFKVEYEAKLKKQLCALGMGEAFDQSKANFCGMDGTRQLYISEVAHKAHIEVNEEGSEAATATGVQMMNRCMPMEFIAEHPFIVLIRDTRSDAMLFFGHVIKPGTQ